jgi:hypothetical protein
MHRKCVVPYFGPVCERSFTPTHHAPSKPSLPPYFSVVSCRRRDRTIERVKEYRVRHSDSGEKEMNEALKKSRLKSVELRASMARLGVRSSEPSTAPATSRNRNWTQVKPRRRATSASPPPVRRDSGGDADPYRFNDFSGSQSGLAKDRKEDHAEEVRGRYAAARLAM